MPKTNTYLLSNAKELRKNMTRQESHLWYDFIKKRPEHWYKQRVIGSYIVDFYCPSKHLVLEIDGSQHYEEVALRYDENRTRFLNSQGIKVIRILNGDINMNFEAVCMMLENEIESIANPLSQPCG